MKGKVPDLPLHVPCHWPFKLILVTVTMSPTYPGHRKGRKKVRKNENVCIEICHFDLTENPNKCEKKIVEKN